MPFDFETFRSKVRGASRGLQGSFDESTSALKDLFALLQLTPPKEAGPREIVEAISHIPPHKKAKYREALAFLQASHPQLKPPPVASKYEARVRPLCDDLELLRSPVTTTTDCIIFGHGGYVPDDERFAGKFRIPPSMTLHFYTIHGQALRISIDELVAKKPSDTSIEFGRDRFTVGPNGATSSRAPMMTLPKAPVMEVPKIKRRDAKGNFIETIDGPARRKEAYKEITADVEGRAKVHREVPKSKTHDKTRLEKLTKMLVDPRRTLDGKVFASGYDCYNYVVKNGMGLHLAGDGPDKKPWNAEHILASQDELHRLAPPGATPWVPHFVYVKSEAVMRLSDIISQCERNSLLATRITHYYFAGCRGIEVGWNPHTAD